MGYRVFHPLPLFSPIARTIMIELNVFPAEDTSIRCKMPDGSSIEIDVLEIEALSHALFTESEQEIPYDEYVVKMRDSFNTKYGYKMGLASMEQLITIKNNVLDKLKKSTTI